MIINHINNSIKIKLGKSSQ